MANIVPHILAQDDPFDYIYEGISGYHGVELRDFLTEMYNDVVIDYRLHPDDDFEKIIDHMVHLMESGGV